MTTFTIQGRLPSLNEYIAALNANRYAGNKMKQDTQLQIIAELKRQKVKPANGKVGIQFVWYEPNQRRDIDNVCFAKKFILDALVVAGIIKDDSQKHVGMVIDFFHTDKENPRIEVTIKGDKNDN